MQRQGREERWSLLGRGRGGWREKLLIIGLLIGSLVLLLGTTALACEIDQVIPDQGFPGDIVVVTLEGFGFGFSQVEQVTFGPGIEVTILDLPPPTGEPIPDSLVVQIFIEETAAPGPRRVEVLGSVFSCEAPDGFTVGSSFPEPSTTIDRVIWNGFPSNIGEIGTVIDLGEGSPETLFLNVVADFNGDGLIADYVTDWGLQPEWLVRNLPIPPDVEGTLLVGASFPILDGAITPGSSFAVGDILLDTPATTPPIAPTGTTVVGTTMRLTTSPGKEEPVPATLQPTEWEFSLTTWGFPVDLVFRKGVPDIPQKPNECAPTATANSLRWLAQNNGFNDKLPASNGDLVKALGQAMKTSSTSGTTDANMVNGKKQFIKDKGLPLTVEGQDNNGAGGLAKAKPTFDFLLEQLRKGQDVEMGFTFTGGGGHWVTVVGLVRFGNKLGVFIHDPDDGDKGTPKTQFYELERRSDGYLKMKGYGADHYIDIIVAESPSAKCPTQKPTAMVSPAQPSASSGHSTPRTITFDGTPSHDNDNCGDPPAIRKYEWTVTENLLPDPEQPSAQPLSGTGPTFTVTLKAPGTYTVQLAVTDNDGETDSTTVQVTIGNRKPRIKITERRVELTPSGQVRRWVIKFKAKDPNRPDEDLQKDIDVSYQDTTGTHQVSGAPPLHVDFTGGWAIVSAEITATDRHGAKGVLNDIVLLWRSGAARQQLQQHLQGGGANAFLQAQLQRILRNKKGQQWIDDNPGKAASAIDRALNRIVNMQLRNTFRKVVVPSQSGTTMALQEEEIWEGMYQEGAELLGIVPTASFSFSPTSPQSGEPVAFDASTSVPSEEGGELVSYEWDFDDDGEVDAEGPMASFTFTAPGDYDVTLRVVDDTGAEDLEIVTVSVGGEATSSVCNYAGADKIIDGADLIRAIQAYARGEIGGAELIQLIQYYATGMECDRPLSGAAAALAAVPFALEGINYDGRAFAAEGTGIAAIDVQVYDLAGRLVFSGTAAGNRLAFAGMSDQGRPLANGVYLYTVTAYGAGGGSSRSRVQKLVLLR